MSTSKGRKRRIADTPKQRKSSRVNNAGKEASISESADTSDHESYTKSSNDDASEASTSSNNKEQLIDHSIKGNIDNTEKSQQKRDAPAMVSVPSRWTEEQLSVKDNASETLSAIPIEFFTDVLHMNLSMTPLAATTQPVTDSGIGTSSEVSTSYEKTIDSRSTFKQPSETTDAGVMSTNVRDLKDMLMQDEEGDTDLHIWIAKAKSSEAGHFINLMAQKHAARELYDVQNHDGQTHLHLAAAVGLVQIASLLIHHGASLSVVDRSGNTSLHVACLEYKKVFLANLLAVGLRLAAAQLKEAFHRTNYAGKAPLHLATECDDIQALKVILNYTTEIDIQESNSGKTALILAIEQKSEDKASLLIAKGADVNQPSFNGWTPLHYASMHGQLKLVKTLLSHAAEPAAKTHERETAKDVAANTEISRLLQSKIRKLQRASSKSVQAAKSSSKT